MKPFVQLTGEDGNVFSIIGRVGRVLRSEGLIDEAIAFTEQAFDCENYDEVLRLTKEYCEIG